MLIHIILYQDSSKLQDSASLKKRQTRNEPHNLHPLPPKSIRTVTKPQGIQQTSLTRAFKITLNHWPLHLAVAFRYINRNLCQRCNYKYYKKILYELLKYRTRYQVLKADTLQSLPAIQDCIMPIGGDRWLCYPLQEAAIAFRKKKYSVPYY